MKRVLVKLLLLILRLILKLAKIFSFKKLELFLTEFLRKKFDYSIEEEIVSKKSFLLGKKSGSPKKIKKEGVKRDKDATKEEPGKTSAEESITISREDEDSKVSDNIVPIVVTAGVAAGVGIASIIRDKGTSKPEDKDLSEVEFNPTDTYEQIFTKGFNKGVEKELAKGQSSKTTSGWFSGVFSGTSGGVKTTTRTIIPDSEYLKYSTTNRLGQSFDNMLEKYSYSAKGQSIGITTPSGAEC